MALDTELQGTFFAYEVLPLHQPALPFGHEFDNTVNQEFIEVDSNALFAEILAGESFIGEELLGDEHLATMIDPPLVQKPDSAALITATESQAEIQVHQEILAEHRYLGSCDAY
jgi:hypothetical protein